MKKNVLMALAISAMLLASCKKEDPKEITNTQPKVDSTEATIQSPIPLKIGNQWVYNVYDVKYDTSGNFVSETLQQIDTLTITRTDVVENQAYFVVNGCLTCGNPQPNSSTEKYLRVENGRLVGPKFKTYYSINSSPEPLDSFEIESYARFIYFVHPYNKKVTVSAGSFENVIETRGESYYYNQSKSSFVRSKITDSQYLYSPQIGLLSDKIFYSNKTTGLRRELVSYKLN